MTRFLPLMTILTMAASLAACTGDGKQADQPSANAANATETIPVGDIRNAATASPRSAAPATDAITRYVGKYPFDKVGDHSWHDDPAIMQAIDAAVADKAVRKWVLGDNGPATPIAQLDGRVASWACEAHNCGPHQWVTLIDPVSGAAEICYFDESVTADRARWLSDGKDEMRAGKCPDVGS